ncbi:hypothetical protein CVT26_012763 [Gymnopilus dilepis]|uniref:Uncharacterized protein n=1 Tax=Gymnopilus dilepis TaxID=231916 RepID=A0A409WDP7_9AGAR|nr:hypothetical protein CVT26_012763 [Gymnopilus dilepis]
MSSSRAKIKVLSPANSSYNFEQGLLEGIRKGLDEPVSPFGSPLSSLTSSAVSSRSASPTAPVSTSTTPSAAPEQYPAPKEEVTLTRKQKLKIRNKEKSKRRREKDRLASTEHSVKPNRAAKHLKNTGKVSATFEGETFPISKKGWISRRSKGSRSSVSLADVVGPNSKYNLELRKWNGRTTMVIVDRKRRIIAVCLGKPENDETWEDTHRRAAEVLESARDRLYFQDKDLNHRRGGFPALAVGISHGGGQKYPKVLDQDKRNEEVFEEILENKAFQRISGFTSGAFAEWAPRLYEYENKCLSDIIEHDETIRRENRHPRPEEKELRRNWPRTPWAATTFNFGPKTVCRRHLDFNNLAFGWCGITALGNYDPTKGGHLILWQLGLVIEFPPGTTILIPSAAIEHSNVRIRGNERRYSVTQYSSGGIFRYVHNGFKTVDSRMGELDSDELADHLDELSRQLEFGLSLYSDVAELEKARGVSFKE